MAMQAAMQSHRHQSTFSKLAYWYSLQPEGLGRSFALQVLHAGPLLDMVAQP